MTSTAFGHAAADTIDDLAARAARWIALEELLFETLGAWARSVPEPAVKRVLATWCHRHAWHAELWRARLPHIPARPPHRIGGPITRPTWRRGSRRCSASSPTRTRPRRPPPSWRSSPAPFSTRCSAALDEHRAAIDDRLDGPTARILDLVAADLAAERRALATISPSVSASPRLTARLAYTEPDFLASGRGHTNRLTACDGGQRPSRLYAHHSNGLQ